MNAVNQPTKDGRYIIYLNTVRPASFPPMMESAMPRRYIALQRTCGGARPALVVSDGRTNFWCGAVLAVVDNRSWARGMSDLWGALGF